MEKICSLVEEKLPVDVIVTLNLIIEIHISVSCLFLLKALDADRGPIKMQVRPRPRVSGPNPHWFRIRKSCQYLQSTI